MIGQTEIELAAARAQDVLKRLREEHPKLKAYLVFAHRTQQTDLTTNPHEILVQCGDMVVANAAKQQALNLISEKKRLEASGASAGAIHRLSTDLTDRLKTLHFAPDAQIEIRFHELSYELIWALQAHHLVDRTLTPQTKASIRIVLGTLDTLSKAVGRPTT